MFGEEASWLSVRASDVARRLSARVGEQDVIRVAMSARLAVLEPDETDVVWATQWLSCTDAEFLRGACPSVIHPLSKLKLDVIELLAQFSGYGASSGMVRVEVARRLAAEEVVTESQLADALAIASQLDGGRPDDPKELGERVERLARADQYIEVMLRGFDRLTEAAPDRVPTIRWEVAAGCARLARWLEHEGRRIEAITHWERSVEMLRQHHGHDHVDTLATLNNLASCLQSVGEVRRALTLFEDCYRRLHEVLGERDELTLRALNNLASCCSATGDTTRARPMFARCHELYLDEHGAQHAATLTALNNLASCYRDAGEVDRAFPMFESCLEQRRIHLGADHPDTLTSLSSVAGCLARLGDPQRALQMLTECYQSRVEVLGARHPDTLTSLKNLALGHVGAGEVAKALPMLTECYESRREVLGDKHPDTLVSINDLAYCRFELGDVERALPMFDESYANHCLIVGDDHPNTLQVLNNLATCHDRLGDTRRAIPLLEACLELHRHVLGEGHPTTAAVMSNLASCLEQAGDAERAVGVFETSLAVMRSVLGEHHPSTLALLNNVAGCYETLGRAREALPIYQDCYRLHAEYLGESHPSTLSILNNLAYCHRVLGHTDEARTLYETSYLAHRQVLGDRHPRTVRSAINVAAVTSDSDPEAPSILRSVAEHAASLARRGEHSAAAQLLGGTPHLPRRLAGVEPSPEEAVSALELIRGVVLQDTQRRSADVIERLEPVHGELIRAFREAVRRLETVEQIAAAGHGVQDELSSARSDFEQTWSELVDRAPEIDEAPDCHRIQTSLDESQALVYLLAPLAEDPAAAIVVTRTRVDRVLLPEASFGTHDAVAAVHRMPASNPETIGGRDRAIVQRMSRWLGKAYIGPIVDILVPRISELVLVPVGELALLPFHAAELADGTFLIDRYDLRYLLLGTHLTEMGATAADRETVTIVAPAMPDLPWCAAEVEALGVLCNAERRADVDHRHGFARALSEASAFHTSCHGVPVNGELCLLLTKPVTSDGLYAVRDAMNLRVRARSEAFIAACSARTPGMEIPDEIIGFPNALHAAGFVGTISAGWPVADLVAALTSIRYYDLRSAAPASRSLSETQRWLRTLTVGGAVAYLDQLLDRAAEAQIDTPHLRSQRNVLADRSPGVRVCGGPIDWAAFAVIGN